MNEEKKDEVKPAALNPERLATLRQELTERRDKITTARLDKLGMPAGSAKLSTSKLGANLQFALVMAWVAECEDANTPSREEKVVLAELLEPLSNISAYSAHLVKIKHFADRAQATTSGYDVD
jgi:hypothetical protein